MSENTTTPAPEAPLSALLTLNNEVSEQIKGLGQSIRDGVKAKFVQEELVRRTDLLARLVVAINNFRKEGYKIKPDVLSFNADGSPATTAWSKPQLEKQKKFTEKLTKAEQTFEKALNNNEYDKVESVIKELQTPDAKETKGDDNAAKA